MKAASFLARIIVFCLVFIFGFVSCAGVLVGGGYLALTKVSLDKLGVNTDKVLSSDAEVDISALPLKGLIEELITLKNSDMTVDLLVDRYGLILPEELDDFLSADQRKMNLKTLLSGDGIKEFLSDVYFGKLFGYEKRENPNYSILHPEYGEQMIWVDPDTDERVVGINGVLADITVAEFLDGGIPTQEIMDETTVGELLELTKKTSLPIFVEEGGDLKPVYDIEPITLWYDKDGAEASTVIAALAEKSISELTTGLDGIELGALLGTVEYKDKTYTYELRRTLDEHIVLTEAESVIAEFADLSLDGLTGGQVNDRVNNVEIHKLMGYKQDADGKWTDADGKPLNAIMSRLATSKVGELNDTIDGLTFGDIAKLVAVGEDGEVIDDLDAYEGEVTWYEEGYVKGAADNVLADGLLASFAGLSVKDMDEEGTLADAVKDTLVGDAMGLVKKDGVWYTDDTYVEEASGIMATLADKKVGDMNDEVDKIHFSEVAGLVAVDNDGNVIEDPDTYAGEITWYEKGYKKGSAKNEKATSVMVALAGLTIGDMNDDGALTDAVGSVIVGEALGYERAKDALGKDIWLTKETDGDGNKKPAKGIMAVIADYKVTELSDRIDEITIGEVSGFEAREEADPLDPSKTVTVWYDEDDEVAGGIMGAIANLTVANMSDEAALSAEIKKVTVGDALGYKAVEENGATVWYERYDGKDAATNVKVSGIMKHVVTFKVGEMSSEVDKITFADISGLDKVYFLKADGSKIPADEVENYNEEDIYFEWYQDGAKASGLMAGLAHLTVHDLGDEKEVSDAVKALTVGDAMGYEKVDGIWYTEYDAAQPEKNRLTGLVKAIADDMVGDMDAKAKLVTVAEVADLIAVDAEGDIIENVDVQSYDGIWYEEYYTKTSPYNKPTSGLMAGLAKLTLDEIRDPDEVKETVGKIAAGYAMGYEKVGDTWYTEYDKDNPEQNQLTGLVKVIADSPVEELNNDIQKMKFGTVAGLTYDEGAHIWKDGNAPATGINAALADLTVGEMSDAEALSKAVQKVTVADAMGYTSDGHGGYLKGATPVEGFMAVIAGKQISEIQNTLDTTEIGEFMGYERNPENGNKWEKNGAIADALMQKVYSKKMQPAEGETGLDGLMDELELRDVTPNPKGLLKIILEKDEDVKIKDLDSVVTELFTAEDEGKGIKMGELAEHQLITIELSENMKSWTFAEFMKKANKALSDLGH